jgi:hypothetical protein
MPGARSTTSTRLGIALATAVLPGAALAGNDGPLVGLDDLAARIGAANVPTGAGVVVGQAEAALAGAYRPDPDHPEFAGKTFLFESGPGGVSGHATSVGRDFYGLTDSIAPGIDRIHSYLADLWVQDDYLRVNFPASTPPAAPPDGLAIVNNSWIGSFQDNAVDNAVLRRADFAVVRDQVLLVNGVNNNAGSSHGQLLAFGFNGLTVGRMDGEHAFADTGAGLDGPGRMKPELVAPGNATSWAAPVVAAAAALMIETARGLDNAASATRTEVIKAALLAGAEHRDGWSNMPATSGPDRGVTDRPLDPIVGADVVNVDGAHRILTGGEAATLHYPPGGCTAGPAGWALTAVPLGISQFIRFSVPRRAEAVSIAATWHRQVDGEFDGWILADVDLHLWVVGPGGPIAPLVGDAGLGLFAGGNVVSASPVDNVEHLYVTGLEPGDYVLEVRRVDGLTSAPTWDVAVAWRFPAPAAGPAADVNGDGAVDVDDLVLVILSWGPCPCCPADVDGKGAVDVDDLIAVITGWTG